MPHTHTCRYRGPPKEAGRIPEMEQPLRRGRADPFQAPPGGGTTRRLPCPLRLRVRAPNGTTRGRRPIAGTHQHPTLLRTTQVCNR